MRVDAPVRGISGLFCFIYVASVWLVSGCEASMGLRGGNMEEGSRGPTTEVGREGLVLPGAAAAGGSAARAGAGAAHLHFVAATGADGGEGG